MPHEAERRFSRREVELVLRDAVDLALGDAGDALLSREEVIALASEAGVSEGAVRRALARCDARSALGQAKPGLLDRLIGPPDTTLMREVPVPLDEAKRLVARHMSAELMAVTRHHGDRIEWQPQASPWAAIKHFFSGRGRDSFARLRRVELSFHAASPDRTVIGMRLDDSANRGQHAWMAALGLPFCAGLLLPAATVHASHHGAAAGAAMAGIGFLVEVAAAGGARASYQKDRQRVADSGERLLDLVAHRIEPEGAGGPGHLVEELQQRLGAGTTASAIRRLLGLSQGSGREATGRARSPQGESNDERT